MTTKESSSARMTIDMPGEDHKRLKAVAALRGKSMRAVVIDCLREELYGSCCPNADTLKAIQKVENNEDIVNCDGVEDLFRKLDL